MALPDLERKCRGLAADGAFHGQSLSVVAIQPLWQFCLNLMGHADGDPKLLEGELLKKALEEAKMGSSYPRLLKWRQFFSMKLAYLFDDLDLAETHSGKACEIYENDPVHMAGAMALTYECLVILDRVRQRKRPARDVWKARRLLRMLKSWSATCPDNLLDKQCLLEAELAWTVGNRAKAHARFRLAIVQSRDQGFWLEEALANEQLGKLYMEENDNQYAIPCIREAQRLFDRWGAKAKACHMEKMYRELLEA